VNTKANLRLLLDIVRDFLERLYTEKVFSDDLIQIVKAIDLEVSKKSTNIGLAVIGGLLFFRLICPSIIAPHILLPKWTDRIPPHSFRSLVLLAKVIQKLATGNNEDMTYLNSFMKQNKTKWTSFFYKLLVGEELLTGEEKTYEVNVEDLIGKSTQDLDDKSSHIREKQCDMIKKLFQLEKNMEGWKNSPVKADYQVFYRKFEGTTQLMIKVVAEVSTTVENLFQYVLESPTVDQGINDQRIVERINENLVLKYVSYKIPMMSDRDFLLLQYSEILPEDQFAVMTRISMVRDDVPPVKGRVRADVFGGYLIRGLPDRPTPTCKLTYIYHADAKGSAHMPKVVRKMGAVRSVKYFQEIVDYWRSKSLVNEQNSTQQ